MKMTPLEQARALDAKIRELGRRENAVVAQIAYRLRRMKEQRLYSWLGKASINAYAKDALGYSASKTRDLVALAERLEGLPKMKQAFVEGELEWTKARSASSAATPESEDEWLLMAKKLSSRQLEREAKQARGEEPKTRFCFEWTAEERATIEDAMLAVRKESDVPLSESAAMLAVAERALRGATGSSPYRVVITVCGRCEQATRQTNDGPIEVEHAALEEAACDAEVVDIRKGPKAMSRTMPPKTARHLDSRDGCCSFPGCNNRIDLDRHHEGGWREVGHDPDRCLRLCVKHHRARHRKEIIIEGRYPDFVFRLADGTIVEEPAREALVSASREARARASSEERASRQTGASREAPAAAASAPGASREAGASHEAVASRREVEETVAAALVKLELKPREARAAIRRARERMSEPAEDVATLLAAALRYGGTG